MSNAGSSAGSIVPEIVKQSSLTVLDTENGTAEVHGSLVRKRNDDVETVLKD